MPVAFPIALLQVALKEVEEGLQRRRSSLMDQGKIWSVKAYQEFKADWAVASSKEVLQVADSTAPELLEGSRPTLVLVLQEAVHSSNRAHHREVTLIKAPVMAMVIPTREDNNIGSKILVASSGSSALLSSYRSLLFCFFLFPFLLICTPISLTYDIKGLGLYTDLDDAKSHCLSKRCIQV